MSTTTKHGRNTPPQSTGTHTLAEIQAAHPLAFEPIIRDEAKARKTRQPRAISGDAAIVRMVAIAMIARNRDRIEAILGQGRVASLGTVPESHWPIYRSAAREVFGAEGIAFSMVRADQSEDGCPKFKLYRPKHRTTSRNVELSDDERAALRAYIGV